MTRPAQERRKYLRIEAPLQIRVITGDRVIRDVITKDISPLGLRFETAGKNIEINSEIELRLEISGLSSPVHANAKVIWQRALSTEDNAPHDIGCEFTKVEEDNKNTFLKYFCDLLYDQDTKSGKEGE